MLDGRPSIVIGHPGGVAALRELVPDAPATIGGLIESWPRWRPALLAALPTAADMGRESDLAWLPPLMPPKLICVGANYSEHNAEMLGEVDSPFPYTFLKPPSTTVIATGQAVPVPAYATRLDYEAELAAVMGPGGSVFGYTVLDDLSVRDWVPGIPILGIDWVVSKGFDRSAPLGPWIVPAESVPDPQNLMIKLWVNGELRQHGSTADMVFSITQCVDHLNRVMTLEPGDVIGTGTPAGVGMGDGRYLTAGDTVRIEIEGIGVQETHIIAARALNPAAALTTGERHE
jgi:2,4-diketo-3-deoxy-L-fuconate hydrolase